MQKVLVMRVKLTPKLETLVKQRVRTGFYHDESEVVREGLRFFFAQEAASRPPAFFVSNRNRLKEKLIEGVRQLDRGERIPGEIAVKELKARAKARARHG